nr:hypothetical protein [Bacillota bacterium]
MARPASARGAFPLTCLLICGDRAPHPALVANLPDFVLSDKLLPGDWTCVFRWGAVHGSDEGHWVVNAAQAVANARGADMAAFLRLNDLAANPALEPRWRVYVFDLRTLGVMQRVGRRWRHVSQWTSGPIVKLRETARRAVYALGLHFGAVDLAGTGKGIVVRVLPDPPLDTRLARRFAQAMVTYVAATQEAVAAAHGLAPGPEVVLGADPEFILRNRRTGRTVSAARFFPRWGVVGLDRACFKRNGVLIYPLAEVRPPPSPDPLELVENLRRAIAKAASAVRGRRISFEAGGTSLRSFSIGGHIHFSNVRLSTDLLRALDNYLALPVLMLENPVSSRLRRPRYGYLGDWRPQPHGGFEYRTPGSWVVSPHYAAAVLCLAKAVAQDYPLLRRNVFLSLDNQRAFYAADKPTLRPYFFALWRDLQQSPVAREFHKHLALVHQMVSEERRWNERVDIKKRWLAS